MAVDTSKVRLITRRIKAEGIATWSDEIGYACRFLAGDKPEDTALLMADHRLNATLCHFNYDEKKRQSYPEINFDLAEGSNVVNLFFGVSSRTWELFQIHPGRYLLTFSDDEYIEIARMSTLIQEHVTLNNLKPINISLNARSLTSQVRLIENFMQEMEKAGYWAIASQAVEEGHELIEQHHKSGEKCFGVQKITSLEEPTLIALTLKGFSNHVNITFNNNPAKENAA